MKNIKPGDTVLVFAGATIRTRHPTKGPEYESQRSKKVTVQAVRKDFVTWIGTGGYTFSTTMDKVQMWSH